MDIVPIFLHSIANKIKLIADAKIYIIVCAPDLRKIYTSAGLPELLTLYPAFALRSIPRKYMSVTIRFI